VVAVPGLVLVSASVSRYALIRRDAYLPTGTVMWFSADEGSGPVTCDDGDGDRALTPRIASTVHRFPPRRPPASACRQTWATPGSGTTDHAASNKETIMSSRGKKKTTFAKLNRETKLRERRAEKEARKQARRLGLVEPAEVEDSETVPTATVETVRAEL
jgi:hypothetical protein